MSASGCCLALALFFGHFSLALLIKVLLIKTACNIQVFRTNYSFCIVLKWNVKRYILEEIRIMLYYLEQKVLEEIRKIAGTKLYFYLLFSL